MSLARIANMTAAEIKANKQALIDEAIVSCTENPKEGGRRYVLAELNAKERDVALGVHAATAKAAEDQLGGLQRALAQADQDAAKEKANLNAIIDKLQGELDAERKAHADNKEGAVKLAESVAKAVKVEGKRLTDEIESQKGQIKKLQENSLKAEVAHRKALQDAGEVNKKLVAANDEALKKQKEASDKALADAAARNKSLNDALTKANDEVADAREFMGTEVGKRRAAEMAAKMEKKLQDLKAKAGV